MARKKSAAKKAREQQEAELAKLNGGVKPLPADIEELKKELREEEAEDEEEESDEEEDDYGMLLTENVENGLNEVLKAIKTGDKRLFDSSVKFFKEDEEGAEGEEGEEGEEAKDTTKTTDQKPLYLKEYHRKALLADEEAQSIMTSVDDIKPYAVQQREDKENLIKEIHNALGSDNEDDESDDDFLIKKEKKTVESSNKAAPIALPDPKKDGEKFLEAFMENHAWLPDKGEEVQMEVEDDEEFDKAAETFENAYNFRYEDPKSTEIISYARSQATMRREKMNSRKRDRLKQQEEARKQKEEIDLALKKKKQKTTNLVADRIKEIKEAVGDNVSEEKIIKVFGDSLINQDFDNDEWDAKMNEIFNDEYYGDDDESFKKPEWSDDDLMNGQSDNDENEEVKDNAEEEIEEVVEEEKKSSKSKKKAEKYDKKKEKNKVKELAERLVESKTVDLLEEVEEERGRDKEKSKFKFKYREVSPESFGLTYNEILKADDKDLNEFIGLKKLAPYRPKEKLAKDKRKVTKSKHLREWRKKTFGSESGVPESEELEIAIPSIVFDKKSKHKSSKHKKRKINP